MENKNKSSIIIIVLCVIIILGLIGFICYDKGVFGKKESPGNNAENKNVNIEEKVTDADETDKLENVNSQTDNSIKSNNLIKVYSSDDNKYFLILTEYPHKSLNPKSNSTTSKDFKVFIDEYYSSSEFYGIYNIEDGKIKLIVTKGCTSCVENQFNCTLPDGANATVRNDNLYEINLNYDDNTIMFGNIKLTLK